MKKLLIGSPIRQKPQILHQFLTGLDEADTSGFETEYCFVDDNVAEESSELLREFSLAHNAKIVRGEDLTHSEDYCNYISDEVTHLWDATTITKVAYFKDCIIKYAIENDFDFLFFVDSDIVIDRRTIQHLYSRNVEIISNVFWTQWKPNWELEPQCFWIPALSRQDKTPFGEAIELEEARQIRRNFFAKMRVPGIYKVDGLGACTLIARSALLKGVRFKEIPNLAVLGEDRHFCVRAGALGIDLYFDTCFPVYHIYREEYLSRVKEFKEEGFKYDMCQTFEQPSAKEAVRQSELKRIFKRGQLYLHRVIKNRVFHNHKKRLIYDNLNNGRIQLHLLVETGCEQYLEQTLESISSFISSCIILNNSGASIKKIVQKELAGKDYKIIRMRELDSNKEDGFHALWKMAAYYDPGWILTLKCGEVMPINAKDTIQPLINNQFIHAYRFLIDDQYVRCLMRYQDSYDYQWPDKDMDNRRFPIEADELAYADIDMRIHDFRKTGKIRSGSAT